MTSLNIKFMLLFIQLAEMTGEAAAVRDQLEQLKVSNHHDQCCTVQ